MSTCVRVTTCVLGIVALVITTGVLCGGYLPNRFFNARAQKRTCHVYTSVHSYLCRFGAITRTCYDVVRNTKPDGATCWQAPAIATFESQSEADAYAASWAPYEYACVWDPENPCEYYHYYADVTGTLYAGIVFGALTVVFSVICIILSCRASRQEEYTEV